jgi:antitoxin ParD1/3/4
VTLSPEDQAFIDDQVASGNYPSAGAVLADAVAALRKIQSFDRKREELRKEIQIGLDDVDAGRLEDWDMDDVVAEVVAESHDRMAEAG